MNKNIIKDNFIYIPNFITPERSYELAKRFTKFCKENKLPGDGQIPESHSAYNYIDFLELLCEKTPEVSRFLGETVLPTYTYARVYHKGSVLERHRDREACEISLTLHLGGDSEWPIFIQKPNGEEVELNLHKGDAMLYRGDIADHWRDKFEGKEYVQVFLHYVRSRGDNNWAFFDRDKKKPAEPKLLNDFSDVPNKSKLTTIKPEPTQPMSQLEDYIKVFDDVLSNNLCDQILKEYKDSTDWRPASVGKEAVVDKNTRNVDVIGLSFREIIAKNPEIRKYLDDAIFDSAGNAIRQYNECFPEAKIEEDSGYELLRYGAGQFYKQHTDSFKLRPRAVSCSFCLNDDYEGGEWSFWDGKKIIKGKKGSVIMFPSNFMYPHGILPVTKGIRYSIITWFI
jgi:hypothetical protein